MEHLVAGPIILRPLKQSDMPALYQFRSDLETLPMFRRDRRPISEAEFYAEEDHFRRTFYHTWFCLARPQSPDVPVGCVYSYKYSGFDCFWTTYLSPAARSLGLAVPACHRFLEWLFATFPLRSIRAEVYGYNRSSRDLLEATGLFHLEGTARETAFNNGQYHDTLTFAAYRAEWQQSSRDWRANLRRRVADGGIRCRKRDKGGAI